MRLGDFTPDRELAARAEALAFRLLIGPDSLRRLEAPFGETFGILGVGIHALAKQVVLFVRSKYLEEGLIRNAVEVTTLRNALNAVALEGENWTDVIGWGTPDPIEQVSSGDRIRGSKRGTAGAPVQWTVSGSTQHGIFIAGHVAGTASAIQDLSGTNLGKVAQCLLPATGGVDVAVVELSSVSPSARLSGPRGLTGATNIDLKKSGGTASDQVVAKAGWFYWSSSSATYLDLYVTSSTISKAGDSGSVAVVSGTNEVVGMLVGASTGSLIQDARTQIGALNSLSGLTL
jgi:hypothetical protein